MKSQFEDTMAEPKTLSATNAVINAYLGKLDFTKPDSIPTTSVIVRSLDDAMSDEQRQTIALELYPGAFRDRINELLKQTRKAVEEKVHGDVQKEFSGSGFEEAIAKVGTNVTEMFLCPQLEEDDLEGLDENEKKVLLYKDSLGMLFVCAKRAAIRDQMRKLEVNITRCRAGLGKTAIWDSIHDVLTIPEGLSVLDWWRQATPTQRKRAVALLSGQSKAE